MIRLAGADDFAAIAAITNHYIRNTAIHFGQDDGTIAQAEARYWEMLRIGRLAPDETSSG